MEKTYESEYAELVAWMRAKDADRERIFEEKDRAGLLQGRNDEETAVMHRDSVEFNKRVRELKQKYGKQFD